MKSVKDWSIWRKTSLVCKEPLEEMMNLGEIRKENSKLVHSRSPKAEKKGMGRREKMGKHAEREIPKEKKRG